MKGTFLASLVISHTVVLDKSIRGQYMIKLHNSLVDKSTPPRKWQRIAINVNTCSNRSSVNTAIKVSGDVFVLECMRYVMVEFFKSERRKNNLLIIISEAEVLEQEKNIHTIIVYPITHNKTCKVKSVWKFHLQTKTYLGYRVGHLCYQYLKFSTNRSSLITDRII